MFTPTPRRYLFASATVALAAVFALLAVAASPGAASANANRATVVVPPGAAKKMGANNLRLVSTGLARGRGARVTLPVTGGQIGQVARVRLGGGFELRVRSGGRARSLRLARLELRLGRNSSVIAQLPRANRAFRLFTVRHGARALRLDRSNRTARLNSAQLILTPVGYRQIARGLGLSNRPRGAIGRLAVNAALNRLDTTPPAPPPPALDPIVDNLPVLARPASAVPVSNASIQWCIRASWIRYINTPTGPGEGVTPSDGAIGLDGAGVPWNEACDQSTTTSTSELLTYRYGFPFQPTSSWYDPVSGTAALYFGGKVNFHWGVHGIDLDFANPEVELNGDSSRLIFRFTGRGGTAIPSARAVLSNLPQPGPASLKEEPPGSGNFSTGEMLGYLPPEAGGSLFASFYPGGAEFGWTQVQFTVPPGS